MTTAADNEFICEPSEYSFLVPTSEDRQIVMGQIPSMDALNMQPCNCTGGGSCR